jgi:hypothetical protein
MARQHGNSRQGPDNLDEAQRNQGRSGQSSEDEFSSDSLSASSSSSSSQSPGSSQSGSQSGSQDDTEDEIEGAYASSSSDDGDTEQLLADGEMVGTWSEDEEDSGGLLAGDEQVGTWSASDEGSDEIDDRSMRAHGADRADGQHGLTGSAREPGSGPRHR